MLFYLKELLTKDDNWNVIDYNAWKNQRFENPWWILVNKISKEVPRDLTGKARSHWYWKNVTQNAIKYRVALVFVFLLIIGFANNWFGQPETLSFIGGLIALIGSAWLTIQGVVKQLFRNQATKEMQAEHANDPLQMYTDRFEEVVQGKKVAIFIDDLDRCEVEPTVKLLEGVQTLFKGLKVLYVMAADGQWLVNCFDKKYNAFEEITSEGQTIGNQFLQKTFQLIVDVPKINKNQIRTLLRKNLNTEEIIEVANETVPYTETEIKNTNSEEELRIMAAKGNQESKQMATKRIEEVIQDKSSELEHYILAFQRDNFMPLNPRQIKRIINLYTMKTQELGLSAVDSEDISQEMILKYILFSNEYPKYNAQLKREYFEDEEYFPIELREAIKPLTPDIIREYF